MMAKVRLNEIKWASRPVIISDLIPRLGARFPNPPSSTGGISKTTEEEPRFIENCVKVL